MPDHPESETPTSAGSANIGWHPDPARRFDLRYHNGRSWTADVSTDGERFVDPAGSRPTRPAAAQPDAAAVSDHSHRPNDSTVSSPGQGPPGQATPGPRSEGNPIATASMVLGIIAVGLGWIPVVVVIGAIAAVFAIAFGITGRRRSVVSGRGSGFATAGLVLGGLGIAVCVVGVLLSVALFDAIDRFENPAANTTTITSCDRQDNEITARGTVVNSSEERASYSVRIYFVRPGTDNPRSQRTVLVDDVDPGATAEFSVTANVGDVELDCIVGAVRGPLPYGIDPGN